VKAVLVRHFSQPNQLQVEEIPQPQASEKEALVKVLAAGINPSDVKNIQGAMAGTTLPRVPGRDFAGIVVEGPAGMKGREVWGTGGDIGFTRDGSHAQYMLIPIAALLEKPANIAMEAAGAAGLTLVTAWSALVGSAGIGRGDSVLILGAAGGVGSASVRIARYAGATVLAAVRGEEQAKRARALGAETVIDTAAASAADQVRARTDGRGADVVFDTTGHLFAESIEAAAVGGRICVISAPSDGRVDFNLRSLYRKELRVWGTDTRKLDVTACAALLAEMTPGLRDGRLQPDKPNTYPLNQAGEAYGQVLQGKGRYCLLPNA
jgi:NADPH2:quinone reductase